jgi:N6-L-threonylcarbamoyladenine synthase
MAKEGNARAYALPRPLLHSGNLDFSFAGLKTAVLVQAQKMVAGAGVAHFDALPRGLQCDLAASTQAAIVDVLVKKSMTALKENGLRNLVVAGGVGANRELRNQLDTECAKRNIRVHYPELHLCTDNGAMIALAAAMRLQSGIQQASMDYAFDVKPRWPLDAL